MTSYTYTMTSKDGPRVPQTLSTSQGSAKINCANENSEWLIAVETKDSHLVGLDDVKKVAERLKLNPRRPSIVKWMAENQNGGFKNKERIVGQALLKVVEDKDVPPRFANASDAIEWIKNELIELRTLDHSLARQLISLRDEINQIKLQKSCTEHQALLDDVTLELEEQDEISDLCDIIHLRNYTSPLRDIGITKMNLNSRRFSLS